MGRLSLFFWSKFFTPAWKKVASEIKYLLVIYSMRVTDHEFFFLSSLTNTRLVVKIFQAGKKYLLFTGLPVDNLLTENL